MDERLEFGHLDGIGDRAKLERGIQLQDLACTQDEARTRITPELWLFHYQGVAANREARDEIEACSICPDNRAHTGFVVDRDDVRCVNASTLSIRDGANDRPCVALCQACRDRAGGQNESQHRARAHG